jgi:predicted PurR-regulated permease PerM
MEFFLGLVEMFRTDPSAFFSLIASYAGLTSGFGGVIYFAYKAIKAIINKLTSKESKELNKIKETVKGELDSVLSDLSDVKQELSVSLKNTVSSIEDKITGIVGGKLNEVYQSIENLGSQFIAFKEVVLNDEKLKLQYELLLSEARATKQVIVEKAEEVIEEAIEESTPIIEDFVEEVKEIVEKPKKKVKFKRK